MYLAAVPSVLNVFLFLFFSFKGGSESAPAWPRTETPLRCGRPVYRFGSGEQTRPRLTNIKPCHAQDQSSRRRSKKDGGPGTGSGWYEGIGEGGPGEDKKTHFRECRPVVLKEGKTFVSVLSVFVCSHVALLWCGGSSDHVRRIVVC